MKIHSWQTSKDLNMSSFLISEINCYNKYTNGSNFLRNISKTISGDPCLNWKLVNSSYANYNEDHNYCRNPLPREVDRPFCYTRASDFDFRKCDIPICGKV